MLFNFPKSDFGGVEIGLIKLRDQAGPSTAIEFCGVILTHLQRKYLHPNAKQ